MAERLQDDTDTPAETQQQRRRARRRRGCALTGGDDEEEKRRLQAAVDFNPKVLYHHSLANTGIKKRKKTPLERTDVSIGCPLRRSPE